MADQLNGVQEAVLNQIASGEGGLGADSYSKLYGGQDFSDFSNHPRKKISLGGGNYTTAAGRYQILAPTWDRMQKKLGLTDFSPQSQDAAAWELARETYQHKTGGDLEQDAANGRVDWSALSRQWSSLQKLGPNLTPDTATCSPQQSQISSGIAALKAAYPQHDFAPVEHNPWTHSLEEIAGNPFNTGAGQ